jgi:hypothetical protein
MRCCAASERVWLDPVAIMANTKQAPMKGDVLFISTCTPGRARIEAGTLQKYPSSAASVNVQNSEKPLFYAVYAHLCAHTFVTLQVLEIKYVCYFTPQHPAIPQPVRCAKKKRRKPGAFFGKCLIDFYCRFSYCGQGSAECGKVVSSGKLNAPSIAFEVFPISNHCSNGMICG